MISGTMQTMWLDVKSGNINRGDFSKLFGAVSHHESFYDGPKMCIPITEESSMKIPDWRGWTDIIAIERKWMEGWWSITTAQGKLLVCTPETLIPVYNPTKLTKGFHGESKYDVKYVGAEEVEPGNFIRVRNIVDPEKFHSIDFDKVVSVKENDEHARGFGYNVITRSGFMNCNDIYVMNSHQKKHSQIACPSNCTGCKFGKNA